MAPQPTQQIPGVYHRKIGDIVVTAISDGYLDGNLDVMRNVDLDKAHSCCAMRSGPRGGPMSMPS